MILITFVIETTDEAATRGILWKKGVLKDFAKFTGKHLCQSRPATLLKKRLWHMCFPGNFAKFLRTPFSQNTSGRLIPKLQCNKRARTQINFILAILPFIGLETKAINYAEKKKCQENILFLYFSFLLKIEFDIPLG